ncbi:MAG: hypothetical protein AAFX50_16725, partial [Acidobacteriota bacterium]
MPPDPSLRRRVLTAAVALWLGVGAAAASGDDDGDAQWRAQQLPAIDGRAPSAVHALHQDRLGFVWIGTDDGLFRFRSEASCRE